MNTQIIAKKIESNFRKERLRSYIEARLQIGKQTTVPVIKGNGSRILLNLSEHLNVSGRDWGKQPTADTVLNEFLFLPMSGLRYG